MTFDQMMAELRTEYVASIPQKITDIESHLSGNAIEVLRDDFHKLKGTGKTYGVPEISDLGASVEKICLDKPALVASVIPLAVQVLMEIYTARTKNEAYDVAKDENYKRILSLL